MIRNRPLGRLAAQNLRRNFRHFAVSAFGIVAGIGAFVFFLGLSSGVRKVILGDIFPWNRVEVIAPKTTLTGASAILDDGLVTEIAGRPEVERAFPKMKMALPAKGWGRLPGMTQEMAFEVGGFADGVDPALVAGEPGTEMFQDWEEKDAGKQVACGPEPTNVCPQDYYCGWDRICHHRVPVLLSRTLLEIYNGSFAPAHGMPRIGTVQEAALRRGMKTFRFIIALGESYVQGSTAELKAAPEQHEAQLVGISDKAMPIGMTVPIGYIRRWNARYVGEAAASQYSSVLVDLKDKEEVASFVSWVQKRGFSTEESHAERFALVINIVTVLFLAISVVIVGLSAVNISHTFYMLITDRKREIGLLRALGASQLDIRKVILVEAGTLGIAGGVLGVIGGVAAAKLVDYVASRFVPDFPFKPTTFFHFSPTLLLGALGFAIAFCVFGAFLPARRAARMQPAQALTA